MESDIQPYRGILLGLFFVTVGMEIDFRILFEMPWFVVSTIVTLVAGKALIVATLGRVFGLGTMSRSGLSSYKWYPLTLR